MAEEAINTEFGSTLLTAPDNTTTAPEGSSGMAEGVVPEPFALELDEEYAFDRGNVDAYAKHCRELGMSREQAQASVDFSIALHEKEREAFARQRQEWKGEMKQDPEFGGDKFDASCLAAKKALAAFDSSGEVRRMLADTGYGDNPAVIRVFARIGKAMAEDSFFSGRSCHADLPLEQRLYK